jgi:uncharacterized protein
MNQVLCVSPIHYEEIVLLLRVGLTRYQELTTESKARQDIIALKNKGYFSTQTTEIITHPYHDRYDTLLNRFIQDLVLEVTQDCNFQCRYCLYANNTHVERNHSKKNMSIATAQACIDYLYEHSKDAPAVRIGFYGGEPFLNFGLIKYAVEYACKKFQSKRIIFVTTTNGSILNDEHIDFIIRHKFELLISNDGPYQDKHRRLQSNGGETSKKVNSIIQRIRNRNAIYFSDNVNVGPVIMPDEDKDIVYEYFHSQNIPKEKVFLHSASLQGVDYTQTFYNDEMNNEQFENSSLYLDFLEKIKVNQQVPPKWCPDGQCVIGVKRLFVTVNGDLYPCEKIIGNKAFCIGSINNEPAINLPKAEQLLDITKLTENECKKCWAFRFCNMCIARCLDTEKDCLSSDCKKRYCEIVKKDIMRCLKLFVEAT